MFAQRYAILLPLAAVILVAGPWVPRPAPAATLWDTGTLDIDTDAQTIFFNAVNQNTEFTTSTTVIGGDFFDVTNFNFIDDLTIGAAAGSLTINLTGSNALQFNVTGNTLIDTIATLNASGPNGLDNTAANNPGRIGGFAGGADNVATTDASNGPGRGILGISGNFEAGGGGGYGGAGGTGGAFTAGPQGDGFGGSPYGDVPISDLVGGSGGAGSATGAGGTQRSTGGAGGGAIAIDVTGTFTLNGTITADGGAGGNGNTGGGGGAGGSIRIGAGTFAGTGTLRADGGNGGPADGTTVGGGGGGGGRILVSAPSQTFTGSTSAENGLGIIGSGGVGLDGGTGTISGLVLPPTETIGNPLINRAANDGAEGFRFVELNNTFTRDGRLREWSFFDDDAFTPDRQITPVIFEDVGGNFIVRGVGTTRTTDESGVQTFDFGLADGSDVVRNSNYYLGWRDGPASGTGNAGVIDWDNGGSVRFFGDGSVSGNLNLAAGTSVARTYSLEGTSATPGSETVGNSLLNRGSNDGGSGNLFLHNQTFTTSPFRLYEWSFFDDDGFDPDRQVTPVILQDVGGTFEITGIGTTRTTTEGGSQRFLFDLVSGSDIVGPGFYLGWKDGTNGINNAGVIDYDASTPANVLWFGTQTSFAVGGDLGAGTTLPRTYSIEGFALLVPEPGTLLLVMLGTMGLAVRRRRR